MPYFGIDLPVSVLKTQPALREKQLGANFAIIGRTQNVNDSFDTVWADGLTKDHAIPWITLLFGQFQASGKPTQDASLVAISHGLHDADLTRWALAIRAYNKPVLITILLQVDRNWALSSAVANGGIPEDASPAWMHVNLSLNNWERTMSPGSGSRLTLCMISPMHHLRLQSMLSYLT